MNTGKCCDVWISNFWTILDGIVGEAVMSSLPVIVGTRTESSMLAFGKIEITEILGFKLTEKADKRQK